VISFVKRAQVALLTLALLSLPLATALAQNTLGLAAKPVGIVSIAPIRENLNDLAYVTRMAGMEDQGELLRLTLGAAVSGIDKDRPIGLYFVPKDDEFQGVAFIPLAPDGLKTILKMYKERLGEPKDVGGGILQVGMGNTAFIKEVTSPNQQSWLFAAADKEHLANLPQDPAGVLGDLTKTYNVAGKIIVPNIPEKLRKMAIDELKLGVERYLEQQGGRNAEQNRDEVRAQAKLQVEQIERLFNESEELLIGIGIDEQSKRIVQDIRFLAKEGSSLAKTMAMQTDLKTSFAGFLMPDASVSAGIAGKTSPEDIARAGATLQAIRGHLSKHIDDSPDIPGDKREAIKALLVPVFDVLTKTIATGRVDGGLTVMLMPKSLSFAAGGICADTATVEKVLKSIVDIGKDVNNFPKLQLNAGSIGDMKLNRLTAPIPPNSPARDVLGDTVEIIIGISPGSVIIAGGKDAEGLLRKVLDTSAQNRDKAVLPVQVNVAVLPIAKFVKSLDENPNVNSVITTLEQTGNDRVTVTSTPATRSSTTRIEIQEGVIKAVGAAAKRALSNRFGGQ
jgi:hypothetical protein